MSSEIKYNYALVCKSLPNSLINGLSLDNQHEPVDIEAARKQHKAYIDYLEESGLKLIEIEPDENYPDCVFVEDVAVAHKNKIYLPNLFAKTRNGETAEVKRKLEEAAKSLSIEIVCAKDKEAFLDGGDVCFTGKEFLVGISSRTNEKGAQELQSVFKDIPVTMCKVKEGLHLKSSMTMFDKNTIIIGTSESSKYIRKQIEDKAKFAYKFVEVDEDLNGSANLLYFNDRLIYPMRFECIYDKLVEFNEFKNRKGLENSEFSKIDGCLTCRSVLLSI